MRDVGAGTLVESARDRFNSLKTSFDGTTDPSIRREEIMKAYGLELDTSDGLKELAKRELEFAERCLEGAGPTMNEIGVRGDLRKVLLIEIGLFGKDCGPPWLLGDWSEMARIIVTIAKGQLGETTSEQTLTAAECIRIWPTAFSGQMLDAPDHISGFIIREISPDSNPKLKVKLIAKGLDHQKGKWVLLPSGPQRCRDHHPEGVPRNLWIHQVDDPKPFEEA